MKKYVFTVGDLADAEDPSWEAEVQAETLVAAQRDLAAIVKSMNEGGVEGVLPLALTGNVRLWARLPLEAILDLDNWETEDER